MVLGLLFYLDEIEQRGDFGASNSLWDYCLNGLRIPEAQAFLRVKATRLIRKYPQAIARLRDGRLNLSTLVALRKALTPENADVLFRQVEGKTKKQAVEIAAMTTVRVVAKSSIRPVKPHIVLAPPEVTELRLAEQATTDVAATATPAPSSPEPLPETYLVMGVEDVRDLHSVSATQCKVTVTAPMQFQRDLEELATLVNHRVPDGDLAGILQYAVRKLLNDLRKKRGLLPVSDGDGATQASEGASAPSTETERVIAASTQSVSSPGFTPVAAVTKAAGSQPAPAGGYSRVHVPEALQRSVWVRDGGCCQRRLKNGKICGSKWQCEFDHIKPVALGGLTVYENLRVLCHRCNQIAERSLFGDEFVDRRIREKSKPRGKEPARAVAMADPPKRQSSLLGLDQVISTAVRPAPAPMPVVRHDESVTCVEESLAPVTRRQSQAP